MPANQRLLRSDSGFSGSDESNPEQRLALEDPRTTSQIKRSLIDLDKRYVFLCPLVLSKHFEALPPQAKELGLLVFRCQRSLLFPEPLAARKLRTEPRVDCGLQRAERRTSPSSGSSKGVLGSAHYRGAFSKDFLQWVLFKEREGSVFWFKPDKDLQKLSQFLEDKYDPVTEQPYRPLLLDPHWWRVKFARTSARYVPNPSLVVASIAGEAGRDVEAPVMQELIYQSNPNLEPVSKWPHAPSMRFLPRAVSLTRETYVRAPKFRGYIDQDQAMDGSALPAAARERTRIGRWPETPRDRLDNLHYLWQAEEASHSRRQAFALHGLSTMGGALTAR